MLKEHIPEYQDSLRTTQIMTYELGGIIRSLIYAEHMERQGEDKRLNGMLAEARIGLADLITQAKLLAEQIGWGWIALQNDGTERFHERIDEIEEGRL